MSKSAEFSSFAALTEAEQLLNAIELWDQDQLPLLADNLRRALALVQLPEKRQREEYLLLVDQLRTGVKPYPNPRDYEAEARKLAAAHGLIIHKTHGGNYEIRRLSAMGVVWKRKTPPTLYSLVRNLVRISTPDPKSRSSE